MQEDFPSGENFSEILDIDRTRLANIELGNITPYTEAVLLMSNAYNTPELCNSYYVEEYPISQQTVTKVNIDDFDRLALKISGS